jgi:endo-1,4-beta-xylanase
MIDVQCSSSVEDGGLAMSVGKSPMSFSAVLALFFCVLVLLPEPGHSQLAKGKSKFLGNAVSNGLWWPSFTTYWNQVTPGNAGKWESVEGAMDNYTWGPLDTIYDSAFVNNFKYKHHCLVWGNQQPSWIASVDTATQRAQVEEWIRLVGERYTYAYFVDVVNEPFHAVPSYSNALGGSGKTGWDWVITAFQYARHYLIKGVKLILNEYNVLQDNTVTTNFLNLIDTLRVRGLIDGIGIQGHYFEFKGPGYSYPVNTLKANLQRLTATGLPVYISEFDINEPVDSAQLANYKIYFPLFWEEPGVKGITLWGYVQGDMWKQDAYLVRSNGTERPALQWLRKYVCIPFPTQVISPSGTTGEPRNPTLIWHSSASATSYRVQVSTGSTFSSVIVDSTVADTLLTTSPLGANTRYFWHVSAINDSGASSYSATAVFSTGDQILSVDKPEEKPVAITLSQNFPNPFNPGTTIRYSIPVGTRHAVSLQVFDALGREVAVLVNGQKSPGNYEITFDGSHLASGVYVYRMTVDSFVQSKTMFLIK